MRLIDAITRRLQRTPTMTIEELPAPEDMPNISVLRQLTFVYGMDDDGEMVVGGYWSGPGGNLVVDAGVMSYAEQFITEERE